MLCSYKPGDMTRKEYIECLNVIKALEIELGMTPGQLSKVKWLDLKALYKAGKLYKGEMNILFNKRKAYNVSLYDCVLNSDCEIVHKTDVYEYKMRERAKAMRNLFR